MNSRNCLKPDEIIYLARNAMEENNVALLRVIFNHYTEKHVCQEPGAVSLLLMEEVIRPP